METCQKVKQDADVRGLCYSPDQPQVGAGRSANLDLLRVVACLSVVMLHTSARSIYLFGQVSNLSWNAANLVDSSMRWCVPVFVMISGALLASKPVTDPAGFFAKRARTIGGPIVVWSLVYLWWRRHMYDEHFTVLTASKEILSGFPYYHLYFLFLIAGLYIFTPAIAAVLHGLPRRYSLTLAWMSVFIACVTVTYQGLSSNAFTLFVPYVGFFALGSLLKTVRASIRVLSILIVASVAVTATLTYIEVAAGGVNGAWGLYFYSYFNPTVIAMTAAVFMLFNNIEVSPAITRAIVPLASLTLGIYVLHPIVLELLRLEWGRHAPLLLAPLFDIPVTFTLTVIICAAVVWALRRIPVIRLAV